MKKTIIILSVLFFTSCKMNAQKESKPITIGEIKSIYSNVLQEKRDIYIYAPSIDTNYFTAVHYPVLYILDGDGYFPSIRTMVHQLSVINGNTALPQMIIVGISNNGNRTRDLAPTDSGGEKFVQFLEKDLMPYIEKNYTAAPYRILIGHSLGGLMAVNSLLSHTALFNAYIATDPSIWWENDKVLDKTDDILKQKDFKGRSLFVAIANTMEQGMDTSQVRKDTAQVSHHIRSILKLTDRLKKYNSNGLRWGYKYYNDDDHASVPFVSAYDGLRFVFNRNRFPLNLFDKRYNIDTLRNMILSHYRVLSKEMGYPVKPSEPTNNQLGYTFLQEKDFERARMFFQLNIDYFPENFNVYDSMADYYLARNEKEKAIGYLKKALSIKSTEEVRTKFEKLTAGK